jgi:Uma2 family endonuclease
LACVTTTAPPARFVPPRRFDNAAEWLHALGDVPLERIIFDPWPGTATEDDLLRLVERDKRLCELIDGTLVEKPAGMVEAVIALNLAIELGGFVKRSRLGIVSGADSTLRMASSRVRLPDFAFFSYARLPGGVLPKEAIPTLAPDLAVEVLSESNTPTEMDQKLREYFQSGTRLVWIVDPAPRTVAIYHAPGKPSRVLGESDSLEGEHVVPGFAMLVADLFQDIPRDG